MTNIGYWVPQDEPAHSNTLIYVIAHESREAAKKNWAAFGNDPEWQKVRDASEVNGKILEKAERSTWTRPTTRRSSNAGRRRAPSGAPFVVAHRPPARAARRGSSTMVGVSPASPRISDAGPSGVTR